MKADYARCVDIATAAALKGMIVPGLMAIVIPVAGRDSSGRDFLAGVLAGSPFPGVLMAIFMANAGGAWDNAKKPSRPGTTAEREAIPIRPRSWGTR